MVHTISLETGEWEAEVVEVFLVLRLENATHKYSGILYVFLTCTFNRAWLRGVWNSEVFLYFFVAR